MIVRRSIAELHNLIIANFHHSTTTAAGRRAADNNTVSICLVSKPARFDDCVEYRFIADVLKRSRRVDFAKNIDLFAFPVRHPNTDTILFQFFIKPSFKLAAGAFATNFFSIAFLQLKLRAVFVGFVVETVKIGIILFQLFVDPPRFQL